jgi:Spy/CpxP family protein refolding chaperone
MKISKVSLFAILAVGSLTVFGSIAQAQDSTPSTNAPAGGKARLGKFDEQLGLTGDTQTKFDAIIKDQQEQLKAVHSDDSLTPEDKKAKMKEIRTATSEKVKALLTPDQYTKYQEVMKKQHGGKGPKSGSSTNAPSATPPAPAPQP